MKTTKTMKTYRYVIVLGLLATGMIVQPPNAAEKHYPLSKKAKKGYVYGVTAEDGKVDVTYKVKGDKKDEVAFQVYEFDQDLNLLSADPKRVKIVEEAKPDFTRKSLWAYVGGGNSFNMFSMAIKFARRETKFTWNQDKHRYDRKTLESEDVKLKNDAGKKYTGYADYYNMDNGNALTLVKVGDKYSMINVSYDLDIKETPLPFDYPVAPVFNCKIKDPGTDVNYNGKELGSKDKVLLLFSPAIKKGIDWKKYTLFICDVEGLILSRDDFTSPSPNMDIMDVSVQGDDIYLFGGSSDDVDALYFTVYGDYTSISGAIGKELKREKMAKKGYDFLHVVKVTKGKVAYATTNEVKVYKTKLRTSPAQKSKVPPYDGKNFLIADTYTASNGDMLITGQKTDNEAKGFMYEDIICLQYDKDGNLKAQFGFDNLNDDNKSTVFRVSQTFIPSPSDKNAVYLELLEVKGTSGYDGFWDAYNGVKTYHPKYYPRIMKFDIGASTITKTEILGEGKYY